VTQRKGNLLALLAK